MQRPGLSTPPPLSKAKGHGLTHVHRKSLARTVDYWVEWLNHAPHSPALRIRRALQAHDLPCSVLHHFVCDCAEQGLSVIYHTQMPLPETCFDLLKAKRKWIEGQLSWDNLISRYSALVKVSLEDTELRLPPLVRQLVGSLNLEDPNHAAQTVVEASHSLSQSWLCEHLAELLNGYKEAYTKLLRILLYRRDTLDPMLQEWQADLEDDLFRT